MIVAWDMILLRGLAAVGDSQFSSSSVQYCSPVKGKHGALISYVYITFSLSLYLSLYLSIYLPLYIQ